MYLSIAPKIKGSAPGKGTGGDATGESGMTGVCPLASMYKKKPELALPLMLLGLALILAGLLIFVEPRIVLWLNAATFVLIGAWLLTFANAIRTGSRELEQHGLSILG